MCKITRTEVIKLGAHFRGLMEEIEICRDKMIRLASETSINNQQVIESSKRLDHLLNQIVKK
ncbi:MULTISPECIES: aspartyl-phosphate phosphatase Spo0E family protein [Bacillaceae]|uniref:aspartyl-phosphate phosphatase Spo0E family protein n=1 Tax=Bacillaceae TaxID=186817 RepID=UPI001F5E7A18|nr:MULTISPECIES: aspartyl-phosphate phosphatase Spo0E family protein [Bacillaceae]